MTDLPPLHARLYESTPEEIAEALRSLAMADAVAVALTRQPVAGDGCATCKGSGEVEALTPHMSGDPQDSYMAPATCPVCDGTGDSDPWMPTDLVLPMTPGWYIGRRDGRIEPLRFDGKYWHHTRMTRDLANPSHWRTFDSISPAATPTDGGATR